MNVITGMMMVKQNLCLLLLKVVPSLPLSLSHYYNWIYFLFFLNQTRNMLILNTLLYVGVVKFVYTCKFQCTLITAAIFLVIDKILFYNRLSSLTKHI